MAIGPEPLNCTEPPRLIVHDTTAPRVLQAGEGEHLAVTNLRASSAIQSSRPAQERSSHRPWRAPRTKRASMRLLHLNNRAGARLYPVLTILNRGTLEVRLVVKSERPLENFYHIRPRTWPARICALGLYHLVKVISCVFRL